MGTETQEMVEEEVVQFVRADQVLCLLLDVAVLVCRDQFGADRRVDDIQQGEAGGIVHLVIGNPFDQVFDQCFRDAAVHAVHRHMVASGRSAKYRTRWRTSVLGTELFTPYIDIWSPL